MSKTYTTLPRLYTDLDLQAGALITLSGGHVHYFRTVLRRQGGDEFRIFNGRDGEWLAEIKELSKRNGTALIKEQLKEQPKAKTPVRLFFSPLKKQRMDIVIEKSVELGVTDLHPILTARTDVRKINEERITAQIKEAAEQCERLDIPDLHALIPLHKIKVADDVSLYGCLERTATEPLSRALKPGPAAFIIGPVGGFDDDEIQWLNTQKHIIPVSLGETVLRAETAALVCLSLALGR